MQKVTETIFAVFKETWQPGSFATNNALFTALWIKQGNVTRNGQIVPEQTGIYVSMEDSVVFNTPAHGLRFTIDPGPSSTGPSHASAQHNTESTEILTAQTGQLTGEAIVRLDQVDFPPGAVAYRHTHPGPGIRYLTQGVLAIASVHGTEKYTGNQAWFEAADSPVVATAGDTHSSFVRIMLLPLEYEGRSTFTLLNEEDAHKPRLQTNTRFFDKRLMLRP